MKRKNEINLYNREKKLIIKVIWWVYILLLFGIVIIKFRGSVSELYIRMAATPFGTNYNLIPFKTIGEQLKNISEGWVRYNLLGNIIPFAPFGFLLPMSFEKVNSSVRVLFVGFTFILFAEIFQFFTRLGSFDADDIILNMIGIMGRYFLLLLRVVKRKGKL